MQEGRDRKAQKSQKQHSQSSVIFSPARAPTRGQYLKESALRGKIAGQVSEFKKGLEDSISDRACHSQLRHRTSAPHQPPHGRGPRSPVLLHPPCARTTARSSSHPSPRHSQHPNQLNAQKQTGRAPTYRDSRRLPGSSQRRHQFAAAFSGGRDQPGASTARLSRSQLSGRRRFEKLLPSLFGWDRASKGCREGHPGGDRCTGRAEPFS